MIGLDRSPAMLDELRRRHSGVPVVVGDGGGLPLRSSAVDIAVLVTAIEFVPRPDVALSEAVRVARRGVSERLRSLRWVSSLFPDGLWAARARVPLGDIIGMAAVLSPPDRPGRR